VSEVNILAQHHDGPDYSALVERSTALKCDRCWRHVPDVGHDPHYPSVCLRCALALDAIDFAPYTSPAQSGHPPSP
jgi:isoleucyl-tRNA synthetase